MDGITVKCDSELNPPEVVARNELHAEITMSVDFATFFNDVYPRLRQVAYESGKLAKRNRLPRECNLRGIFCRNGIVMFPYESAWMHGYDSLSKQKMNWLKEGF